MQTALGGQLMLTLAAGTATPTPDLPPVLDPFTGSPMGMVPGGLYASPAAAGEAQLSAGYLPDTWSMTTLPKGSIVFGGVPGQSAFYTDFATVRASGLNQQSFWESLQVPPSRLYGYRGPGLIRARARISWSNL